MPIALIGRVSDQRRLDDVWDRAVAGHGGVALISGEAGIGKSSLANDLVTRRGIAAHVLRVAADADHIHADLAPFDAALPAAAAFASDADAARTPIQRRDLRLAALDAAILDRARRSPLLLLVDDAQWLDPTSLMALTRLVDACVAVPLLIVITARRHFEAPFALLGHVVHIVPRRLGPDDARRLVAQRRPDVAQDTEQVARIVATADGLPLFLEALVDDLDPADDVTPVRGVDAALARLFARLGSDADIAAVAAAIGQTFDTSTLACIMRTSEAAQAPALTRLIARDVLAPAPGVTGATLAFRHALIRDAAYALLSDARKRALHGAILDALDGETAVPQALLAVHADRAGDVEAMIQHSLDIGRAATGRGSAPEAVAVLRRALAAASRVDDPQRRDRAIFDINLRLGPALMAAHGYTSDAAFAAFSAARDRLDLSQSSLEQLQVLLGVFNGHFGRGELERAYAVGAEADELLARGYQGYPLLRGQALCFMGRLAQAEVHLQRALTIFQSGIDAEKGFFCSSQIVATAILSKVAFARGDIARAITLDQRLTELAAADPHPIAGALAHTSRLFLAFEFERDPTAELNAALTHAQTHGLATYRLWFRFYRALLRVRRDPAAGVDEMAAILAEAEADGARLYRPTHLGLLAAASARAGRIDQAGAHFAAAITMAETTAAGEALPALLRLRARYRAGLGDAASAEADLRRGLTVAESQGAFVEEVRIAMALLRHLTAPVACADIAQHLDAALTRLIGASELPDTKRAVALLGRSITR